MKSQFIENDSHGLEVKIPYYCITLTKEEFSKVKGLTPHIYKTDGKTIFEVREANLPTGEYVCYVVFMP